VEAITTHATYKTTEVTKLKFSSQILNKELLISIDMVKRVDMAWEERLCFFLDVLRSILINCKFLHSVLLCSLRTYVDIKVAQKGEIDMGRKVLVFFLLFYDQF